MQKSTTNEKRMYRVIVKNTNNEIIVCHLFESQENALTCFDQFLDRYSYYNKVIIDATLIEQ